MNEEQRQVFVDVCALYDSGKLVSLEERREQKNISEENAAKLTMQRDLVQTIVERTRGRIEDLLWAMARDDVTHVPEPLMYEISRLEKAINELRKVRYGK